MMSHVPPILSQGRRLVFSRPANNCCPWWVTTLDLSAIILAHHHHHHHHHHQRLTSSSPSSSAASTIQVTRDPGFWLSSSTTASRIISRLGSRTHCFLTLSSRTSSSCKATGGSIEAQTMATTTATPSASAAVSTPAAVPPATTNALEMNSSSSSSASSNNSSSNDELNQFVSEEDESVGSPAPPMDVLLPDLIMDRARKMNCFFLNRNRLDSCKPLIIEDFQVGLITPEVLRELERFPDVFVCGDTTVQLHPSLQDYASRSEAVEQVLNQLRKNDVFVTLRGWRDECYEVRVDISEPSLMRMERAATCLFGIRQFGVDINGYVKHPELGLCLWMQRRSKSKPRWGGKLDNVVGGGLSVGFTVEETAHKEAMEEAGIPEYILKNLQPVGTVMIFFESERGLSPNTEFVYDLEFPPDFMPENQDGEVESFHLVPIKDVLPIVLSDQFKTTSLPVVLDFLVRHGIIDTEAEPELHLLSELLHIPLGYFYRRAGLGTGPGVPPPPLLPPPLIPCKPEPAVEPEHR